MYGTKQIRSVRPIRLRFKNEGLRDWWLQQLTVLEAEHFKRLEDRADIVRRCLPPPLYNKVAEILGFPFEPELPPCEDEEGVTEEGEEARKDSGVPKEEPPEKEATQRTRATVRLTRSLSQRVEVGSVASDSGSKRSSEDSSTRTSRGSIERAAVTSTRLTRVTQRLTRIQTQPILEEEPIQLSRRRTTRKKSLEEATKRLSSVEDDMSVRERLKSHLSRGTEHVRLPDIKKSPYRRFLEKGKRQDWRPDLPDEPIDPQTDEAGVLLSRKADEITKSITKEFCDWLRGLGGKEVELDEETVGDLFQIGFDSPIIRSLAVRVRELKVLPTEFAKITGVPHMAVETAVQRELQKDFKALKRETRISAFGRTLAKDLKLARPSAKELRRWEIDDPHYEQTSMAEVWRDIIELYGTRSYCKFLKENPQYPKPRFLVDQGMFQDEMLELENPADFPDVPEAEETRRITTASPVILQEKSPQPSVESRRESKVSSQKEKVRSPSEFIAGDNFLEEFYMKLQRKYH